MTDLVERLRKPDPSEKWMGRDSLMSEAADEIERLRTALEELRALVQDSGAELAYSAVAGKQS